MIESVVMSHPCQVVPATNRLSAMLSPFQKLRSSLGRTKDNLFGKLAALVGMRKIDEELLDEIEEILIGADVGVAATNRLLKSLRESAKKTDSSENADVMALMKAEIISILSSGKPSTNTDAVNTPAIWLITGVNGAGKTTTVGKLAALLSREGNKVMIGACDTFRAAAIDQIEIWAKRGNIEIVRGQPGADPSAVAFNAAAAATARGVDLLLLDTAGRLHTKANLMSELTKLRRVVQKAAPNASVYSKLVLDGTTGQNALTQVKVFTEAVGCDGLIITKLDGTARGGVVIAIAAEMGVPVDYIGIGEGIEDIQPFDATKFTEALFS